VQNLDLERDDLDFSDQWRCFLVFVRDASAGSGMKTTTQSSEQIAVLSHLEHLVLQILLFSEFSASVA
jgi:hypothetical protein